MRGRRRRVASSASTAIGSAAMRGTKLSRGSLTLPAASFDGVASRSISSTRRSCSRMPAVRACFARLEIGIALNPAVVPQDTVNAEAIEPRRLATADRHRERVLAGGVDNRRAPVRLPSAASDLLFAAVHLEGHGYDGAHRSVAKCNLVAGHIGPQSRSTVTSSSGDAEVTIGCTSGTGENSSSDSTIGSTPYRSRSSTRTGSAPSRTLATCTVF